MTIFPNDEINALQQGLSVHFEDNGKGRIKSKKDAEDIIDELFDLFLLSYANGVNATNVELGKDAKPSDKIMEAAVYKVIAGKTWRDRVMHYYETGGTLYDIQRIAETDATRIYNQGTVDAVTANGMESSVIKRWHTMGDNLVRPTHEYIDYMDVPFEARFYTFDGDSALFPGDFEKEENNINCRCHIEIIGA